MERYERHLLQRYALAALTGGVSLDETRATELSSIAASTWRVRSRRPGRAIAKWLLEHADQLGCELPPGLEPDAFDTPYGKIDRDSWKALAPLVANLVTEKTAPPPSALQKRIDWLTKVLSLSAVDREILMIVMRSAMSRVVHSLGTTVSDAHARRDEIALQAIVTLTGRSYDAVRPRLKRSSPLRLLGLIEDRHGNDYAPSRTALRIARMTSIREEKLRVALLGAPCQSELAWDDFDHVGQIRDLAERLVQVSMSKRTKGVNILLHGAPGTGKTQFARALAARLGAHAAFIGEADDEDGEPTRADRISAFAVARALAARAGRIILVVDEADDIFTGVDEDDGGKRQGSKVFMNRLVETTEAPTIWITNNPQRLGPAVMRRMSLAIHLTEPGRKRRRKMLEQIAIRRRIRLQNSDLDRLVAINAAPALLDAGLRVAKLTRSGSEEAMLATRSIVSAMSGRSTISETQTAAFYPEMSSADTDLTKLADQITRCRGGGLSFCFYGIPGTGKSAYARYLADRLGVDVVEKRASDLLSMWVGGTEQAIAAAFEEAADRKAMLVFDEADSLLRNRVAARESWEVTRVNEMLTRMEAASHPVVCTTNLMESLDAATLRRFLFKVEFRPMNSRQARAAFVAHFGCEPPSGIDQLGLLAPGDFSVVARKANIIGGKHPQQLLEMLAEEVRLKKQPSPGRIGFL